MTMLERYPSNKNLNVAYQGDFEDAAWTEFSDAQLPPRRVTLEDFAKHPFIPGEISSKGDYVRQVMTRFADALKGAGYKADEVDGLISKSLDAIDFNRPEAAYVADINRIIQNFYKAAPGNNPPAVEKVSLENTVAPQAAAVDSTVLVSPTVPATIAQETGPNPARLPQLEDTSEAFNLRLTTEFDEREAENAEYGNRKIEPVLLSTQHTNVAETQEATLTPIVQPLEKLILENPIKTTSVEQPVATPFILTPEMQVLDSNEPIVLEAVETGAEVHPEKLDLTSVYQTKLDTLNGLPFNRNAYAEYTFDLHSGLHHEYDLVISSARNNLKRFDGFYAPSIIEKQALQLLSSVQGQFAKMQKAESEIGILRAELTNNASEEITITDETAVKMSAQKYLDEANRLFLNISKLEDLVEVVKTEEKPSVAEVYRAQFALMQTEGTKVLQSLPKNHPVYERLKVAIESDLQELITKAATENGGDTAVLEQSSNFMARREQIKDLIAFIKQEQEYQDFFERARVRVRKLEVQFETIPDSEQGAVVKTILVENIVKIKQTLSETNPQIATVGVLENLKQQKSIIEMLLRDSEESLMSLPQSETVMQEPIAPRVLSDAELVALIEKTLPVQNIPLVPESYLMRPGQIKKYLATQRERQNKERTLGSATEKVKQIVSKFPLGKIGKAAVVLMALAGPAGLKSEQTNNKVLGGPLMSASFLTTSTIDYATIAEYLRRVDSQTVRTEAIAPSVTDVAPELPATSLSIETVPGVILPDTVASPERSVGTTPLEIFSDDADRVPSDQGIVFNSKPAESIKLGKYLINYGDIFWDINEGQTLAGKLPVLSQINPYFKQALIDRMRDKINSDSKVRSLIGGFGKDTTRSFADQLVTGEYMDLDALNKLAIDTAADYSYLKYLK